MAAQEPKKELLQHSTTRRVSENGQTIFFIYNRDDDQNSENNRKTRNFLADEGQQRKQQQDLIRKQQLEQKNGQASLKWYENPSMIANSQINSNIVSNRSNSNGNVQHGQKQTVNDNSNHTQSTLDTCNFTVTTAPLEFPDSDIPHTTVGQFAQNDRNWGKVVRLEKYTNNGSNNNSNKYRNNNNNNNKNNRNNNDTDSDDISMGGTNLNKHINVNFNNMNGYQSFPLASAANGMNDMTNHHEMNNDTNRDNNGNNAMSCFDFAACFAPINEAAQQGAPNANAMKMKMENGHNGTRDHKKGIKIKQEQKIKIKCDTKNPEQD